MIQRVRLLGDLRPTPKAPKGEGAFQVKFSPKQPIWANHDIVETDYDNYCVVYSCTEAFKGLFRYESAWILMRKPYPLDSEEFNKISLTGKSILKIYVPSYDLHMLRPAKQGEKEAGCYYGYTTTMSRYYKEPKMGPLDLPT